MLELTEKSINNKENWKFAGIKLPEFDYLQMAEKTKENPIWIHFGAGNIFRGFIAQLQQQLLNKGLSEYGIIATDTFDYDIIDKIYKPYDNLTMLVSLFADGQMKKEVIGSIAEALKADFDATDQVKRLKEIFKNPSLQMVSFTITEKGYALNDARGDILELVTTDFINGPDKPRHAMSIITALVYERYLEGELPIALVSMDNCSHNGEKLQAAILKIANEWINNGFVNKDFLSYLNNESKVSFPWSMIDKITPRPSEVVKDQLEQIGLGGMAPIVTSRNTFIAPFVNAEVPQYLVIEDKFPNGRPCLEKAGVYFTDRDTVNNTERMKVTTCLNPLHTALAVYGCLLGYTSIAKEMMDTDLKLLVEKIGYKEGIPVVVDPKIFSSMVFIKEVIEERLPNPFIPDAPQRIATDTSQKMAIRFGETIKSYIERTDLNPSDLVFIPLAIAGWLRYLMGVDDNLKPMDVSSDPMLEELKQILSGIEVGKQETYNNHLESILSNPVLFAVNLYEAGLANKVERYFLELIKGKNAVRNTLKKYLYE
ncbi:MAG: mannitol dehydrogenase family protein [Firmicutes bacterium HGW-Firmicutes-7]|nr:MAG: mannitol dehydrogenase family protein [Firmicutes bacterium HGW-Firmicutes-7]